MIVRVQSTADDRSEETNEARRDSHYGDAPSRQSSQTRSYRLNDVHCRIGESIIASVFESVNDMSWQTHRGSTATSVDLPDRSLRTHQTPREQ